jgi:hypothetical protein
MTSQRQVPLDLDFLKTCRVWIAIPAYGGQSYVANFTSILKLILRCRDLGIVSTVHYLPNESLVTRARNNLTDMFMHCGWDNPDRDFLLWIDGDVTFDASDVIYMIQLMKSPQYDILAAPYTRKGLHMDRIAEAARLGWPSDRLTSVAGSPNINVLMNELSLTEPSPILESGTGFLFTRRKVYTQIAAAHPELVYKRVLEEQNTWGRDTAVAYFLDGIDPESRQFLSEDWWFCRQWIRLGGTIHGCMWIQTGHIGTYIYPMNMPAIAELLDATGGFLHGPTKPKENENAQMAEDGNRNGTKPDISRLLSLVGLDPSSDQATIKGYPSEVGGGARSGSGTGVLLQDDTR